jgi:hypothetical protein
MSSFRAEEFVKIEIKEIVEMIRSQEVKAVSDSRRRSEVSPSTTVL